MRCIQNTSRTSQYVGLPSGVDQLSRGDIAMRLARYTNRPIWQHPIAVNHQIADNQNTVLLF